MARCNSCNGVITRTDSECYVCGEPIPGARKRFFQPKPKPPSLALQRVAEAGTNPHRLTESDFCRSPLQILPRG
jgi:hypothetical protein